MPQMEDWKTRPYKTGAAHRYLLWIEAVHKLPLRLRFPYPPDSGFHNAVQARSWNRSVWTCRTCCGP